MNRSPIRRSATASAALAVGAVGAIALAIWIHLTDPMLSAVCWPEDIHESIVRAFGGAVYSMSGILNVELTVLAVAVRVGGFILSLVTCRYVWLRRSVQRQTVSDTLAPLERPGVITLVWLVIWFLSPIANSMALIGFVVSVSPYLLAVILAMLISDMAARPVGQLAADDGPAIGSASMFGRLEFAVVVVAMLAWEATSFWMNERLYAGLLVPHGDSAMYEEHLWNVWHGKGFRSYLDQGLFLGEHIQIIHLLLLPLHMIWPSYLMMELVASSCLAICAIPIYSITRRHSGSSRAAMWLALAWLFYFPMHYLDIAIDLKTLRPSCYGMPFLFWGIDLGERRRFWKASTCLLIALSTQEDFALIVGPIGFCLYLASRDEASSPERKRFAMWSLGVLAFSVVYLLLAVLVVIPAFRGGAVVHYSRYFGDLGSSPGELIRTAIREPMKVLSVLFSFRTALYVVLLGAPLAFASLRRPRYLIAAVATFGMLSLIQLGNEANAGEVSESSLPPIPYHHFHAPLLPVLFWAAAASLKQKRTSADRARWMFASAVLTAVIGSAMPMGAGFWSKQSSIGWTNRYVHGPRAEQFPKVMALIPPSARVASTDYVHTHLTHCERSYDYSGYLRAINNYQPGVPADTDFIVIDTSHPYSTVRTLDDVRELNTEPDRWEVLPDETNGLFIVLKRR